MTLHTGSGIRATESTLAATWRDWFDSSVNQGALDTATIPSAAYSVATHTSAILTPPMWARGVLVYINITNANSGTVTVTVQGVDPVGKTDVYAILASTALGSNGLTVLTIYPGLTAANNSVASNVIPAAWNIKAVVATDPVTYSIAYSYVP